MIVKMVEATLSEPYSFYTYRYFTSLYPELCILAFHYETTDNNMLDGNSKDTKNKMKRGNIYRDGEIEHGELVGLIIGKVMRHESKTYGPSIRGYIGMLCVKESFRKQGIGKHLIQAFLDTITTRKWPLLYELPTLEMINAHWDTLNAAHKQKTNDGNQEDFLDDCTNDGISDQDWWRKGHDEYAVEEIVLEAECENTAALKLYESFGFFRDKRLVRYYQNGSDAFRLKLFADDYLNKRF